MFDILYDVALPVGIPNVPSFVRNGTSAGNTGTFSACFSDDIIKYIQLSDLWLHQYSFVFIEGGGGGGGGWGRGTGVFSP